MRVMLADPPQKQQFYDLSYANLGILYLIGYLRDRLKDEAQVYYLEGRHTLRGHLEEIARFAPDVYGLSFAYPIAPLAYQTLNAVKERFPSLPVVCGGPHPSSSAEHVLRNTQADICVVGEGGETLLELVKHFSSPKEGDLAATCFVLGTVAEAFPELVREIHAAGHEVATHGYSHQLLYKLTVEQFRADVQRSVELLESITDEPVRGYRAPYFSVTRRSRWALEVLAQCGLRYDSSLFPIRRKLYGFPGWEGFPHVVNTENGASLLELPISTITLLGRTLPVGGGDAFDSCPAGSPGGPFGQ